MPTTSASVKEQEPRHYRGLSQRRGDIDHRAGQRRDIDHAAQLSRSTPELAVGMHFVLTLGEPLSAMPGLTRDGRLGKWIWQQAEEDSLPLEEIAHELACQYRRFVELFGHEPTHIDSHHHVHMFAQIYLHRRGLCPRKGVALAH